MRYLAFIAMLVLSLAAMAQEQPPLDANNVLSWPRAGVDKFGCMLEKDFETRDPRFNCSLRNYVNRANACGSNEAYYEGPEFPANKAEKVMPQIERISVAHERGQVQAVTLILKQRQTQTAIRALLGLPTSPRAALPSNIVSVDIQGCRPEGAGQICNVVLLQGFDHMGAGDVECGEEGDRPEPTPDPNAAPQPQKE
jgi:hypothetical protein